MSYKKISKNLLIAFIALTIITPSFSLAVSEKGPEGKQTDWEERQAERDARKQEIQTQKTEKTCTQISQQAEKIQSQLAGKISLLAEKQVMAENKLASNIAKRTTEREIKRVAWDQERNERWAELRAAAKTDEQKEAVEKFILAIQVAVKTKRESLDQIILTFRTGIKEAINARKSGNSAALESYKNSIATISSQVAADCESGKDAKNVREYFRTEMKNARETFRNNRKPAEKLLDAIAPLKEVKKAELKAVIDTFQASIEAAKTELRASFPAGVTLEDENKDEEKPEGAENEEEKPEETENE